MDPKQKRERNTPEKMRELFERRTKEGWSLRQLASESGISMTTLNYWRGKLKREAGSTIKKVEASSESFIPIDLQPISDVTSGHFEVVMPSGCRVFVPHQFNPDSLAQLLGVLRSSC